MPGGDRTGPMGAGPMSGRRMGYCAGYSNPGYANPVSGYGGWFGHRGGGYGYRHWYYATGQPGWMRARNWPSYVPPSGESELSLLKEQSNWLRDQLAEIERRIDQMEKKE